MAKLNTPEVALSVPLVVARLPAFAQERDAQPQQAPGEQNRATPPVKPGESGIKNEDLYERTG